MRICDGGGGVAGGLSVTIGFFAVGGILQKFIYSGWAWRSFEVVVFSFLD